MDLRTNPYAPGAGTKPPALVGRDEQIESFDILLERLENRYAEKSMIISGLMRIFASATRFCQKTTGLLFPPNCAIICMAATC